MGAGGMAPFRPSATISLRFGPAAAQRWGSSAMPWGVDSLLIPLACDLLRANEQNEVWSEKEVNAFLNWCRECLHCLEFLSSIWQSMCVGAIYVSKLQCHWASIDTLSASRCTDVDCLDPCCHGNRLEFKGTNALIIIVHSKTNNSGKGGNNFRMKWVCPGAKRILLEYLSAIASQLQTQTMALVAWQERRYGRVHICMLAALYSPKFYIDHPSGQSLSKDARMTRQAGI